jgi:uncharacterized iron-regulated protein
MISQLKSVESFQKNYDSINMSSNDEQIEEEECESLHLSKKTTTKIRKRDRKSEEKQHYDKLIYQEFKEFKEGVFQKLDDLVDAIKSIGRSNIYDSHFPPATTNF